MLSNERFIYALLCSLYCVMKSDGNHIFGHVVLDSFNKGSRDEVNILNQIYKNKYVRITIMVFLILYNIVRKYLLTQQLH